MVQTLLVVETQTHTDRQVGDFISPLSFFESGLKTETLATYYIVFKMDQSRERTFERHSLHEFRLHLYHVELKTN
jgi:hypothetical protein